MNKHVKNVCRKYLNSIQIEFIEYVENVKQFVDTCRKVPLEPERIFLLKPFTNGVDGVSMSVE